ncbi:MAG: N-acetylmuramoyl-L-alanine amidase [Acutalibacteraceae bacterium]
MKKGLYLIFDFRKLLFFAVMFFAVTVTLLFFAFGTYEKISAVSRENHPTIIIDPGHGGEDGGTQSKKGDLEKDINLSISLKLEKILKEKGYKVIMTRADDKLIYDSDCKTIKAKKTSDLHNRMKVMENNPDSIFLSIHQNYFTQSKYSGAQVFYTSENAQSKALADSIQKSIVSDIQPENTRLIKKCTDDVYLIYNAVNTAVMVECGFLSNEKEAQNLTDEAYQQKLSQAIVKGLENYLTESQ